MYSLKAHQTSTEGLIRLLARLLAALSLSVSPSLYRSASAKCWCALGINDFCMQITEESFRELCGALFQRFLCESYADVHIFNLLC